MYSMTGRIRYSEVNSEKKLTLQALMDYLQDCCAFQSEDLGVGTDYLAREHRAWVLSAWQIELCKMPQLGETIRVNTWPYDFKGFYGYRNFTIERDGGETLVRANSLWVFMDTEKMRPARITEDIIDVYRDSFGPMLAGDWGERKITEPAEGEAKEPVAVAKFFIDTNHHMNNSRYVTVAEEFLPDDFRAAGIRVDYKRAAMPGDMLYPAVTEADGEITVVLADAAGKPYALVVFLRERQDVRKWRGL